MVVAVAGVVARQERSKAPIQCVMYVFELQLLVGRAGSLLLAEAGGFCTLDTMSYVAAM